MKFFVVFSSLNVNHKLQNVHTFMRIILTFTYFVLQRNYLTASFFDQRERERTHNICIWKTGNIDEYIIKFNCYIH